ncbi:hypothetical protein AN8670.2 [Aspergillus nidulans FGSC A4]|nr:hypothetical protein AN8670.2 [Aspergillus nidulans FGSC A4]|eukprot:XP_681939.1 hypothetical protein AN8670.2 [Aspergillus nidulans FGSC A4]
MSALAPKYQQYLSMADDIQSTDTKARSDNENVTEIVRFLQYHVPTPAQSTGPRDMIKAGQRRLKLALRNKRGTESKLKAEEASRQLAALQQQGSFPRSQYRRWGNKQSAASTASSSKSATDLSYKSSSKRDVEGIGRPWLEHPLEKRDEPGSKGSSQVSSLDLRDLASFVEAAVNFSQADDTDPPPYQPLTEQCATPTVTPGPSTERMPRSDALSDSAVSAGEPGIENSVRKVTNELPIASSFHRSVQPLMSSERLSHETQNLESKLKRNGAVATKPPQSSSSTSSKSASAPTTPVLKLFPDAISPRTSSKQALRISTGRSSTPKQSLPSVPASQSTPTLPSVFESNDREFRTSSNSLPKIQEHVSDAHGTKQSGSAAPERPSANSRERLEPQDSQTKHARRPSSLPPGAIDAFPIPAPAKPLPTVPEPNTRIDDVNKKTFLNQQTTQLINMRPHIAELPGSMPPGISISSPSSPEDNNSASRGRDSPFPRLLGSMDPATTDFTTEGPPVPIQPRRGSLGKAGRSREAKVRSLIMKDLARSRHLKSPSKGQIIDLQKEEQASQPRESEDSGSGAQGRYRKVVSPGPSSPPPTSPPPQDPPRHTLQGRQYCTPPAGAMAAAIENYENLSNSTASRKHQLYRKNSVRNFEMKPEKKSMKQKSPCEEETPLPSSDDEGPVGDLYWNPPRKTTRRHRRGRPEPIIVDKPVPERGRSVKKHLTTNSMSPATLQNYSRRSIGKTPQTHLTSRDHHTYDLRSRHSPESKPNPTLEGRIEHLERQNKILQAALLAALDVGVKQDLSSLLGASVTSTTTPPLTGTSFSTTTNTSGSEASSVGQDKHAQNGKVPYQPESWIASPDSFKNNYDSDTAETRELEQMIDEFDLDWSSDRSSTMH